jgi:hypothetical protein
MAKVRIPVRTISSDVTEYVPPVTDAEAITFFGIRPGKALVAVYS